MLLIGIYIFYENWSTETFGNKAGLGLRSGDGNSVLFSHGLLSHKPHNKSVTSDFIFQSSIPNFMTGRSYTHRAYRGIPIPPMWSVARKESWQDFFVIHPKPKANERVNQAKQKDLPFPSWLPSTKKPQGQACNNAIFVSIGRWRRFQGNLEKSSSN